MTAWIALASVSVIVAVAAGWALPAWAAGRLVRANEAKDGGTLNFRGRPVSLGLGLVWLVWAVGVAAAWNLIGFCLRLTQVTIVAPTDLPPAWLLAANFSPLATVVAAMPFLLVVGAVCFGLADDAYGGAGDKGFRGHLRALRQGRLTTGMLKLIGIGALAFVSATGIANAMGDVEPAINAQTGWSQAGTMVLAWVLATMVIALAANLVNLTDLRPGRALKTYALLAIAGVGLSSWAMYGAMEQRVFQAAAGSASSGLSVTAQGLPTGLETWVWLAGVVACMFALALGPVFAVWRYDLGERAMLGDAGANAMGAFAGFLLARSAPLWLLGAFAFALLALNLVSESVSFSGVIERVPVLRWLDGLGRLPEEAVRENVDGAGGADEGTRAGGPAAGDDDARRDDVS